MGDRVPRAGPFMKLGNRGDPFFSLDPRLFPRAFPFSLAPAFRPGLRGNFILQAVLAALGLFGFSPCARPRAKANSRKPAEAGWEKSGGFADPGVNAWAREKSRSFINNPGKRLGYGKAPPPLFSGRNLVSNPGAASRKTGRFRAAGFTLIELIIVISIMLILISIAAPIYRTSIIRSREAVLRDNLFTMRALIDQYTVDKQEAPQSLQDLVAEGYLRDVPVDPFTGANNTWEEVYESDVVTNPDQTVSGITDVHSGSSLRSLTGDLYSSW